MSATKRAKLSTDAMLAEQQAEITAQIMALTWSDATTALARSCTEHDAESLAIALSGDDDAELVAKLTPLFAINDEWAPCLPTVLFGVIAATEQLDDDTEDIISTIEQLEVVLDAIAIDKDGTLTSTGDITVLDIMNGDEPCPDQANLAVHILESIAEGGPAWLSDVVACKWKALYS